MLNITEISITCAAFVVPEQFLVGLFLFSSEYFPQNFFTNWILRFDQTISRLIELIHTHLHDNQYFKYAVDESVLNHSKDSSLFS